MSDNHTDDSLSAEISPVGYKYGFEEEQPQGQDYLPWHKPRKQWLRYNQWCSAIRTIRPQLRLHERPLSYLSLPGDELLDFRVITNLCGELGVKVKLVGFNDCRSSSNSNSKLVVAKNEVFANDSVFENSDVHPDDFKKISDVDSMAYKFAEQKGPYDVINLDLCGSFSGANQQESYYKATLNLMDLQIQRKIEPWLFLLTTRADKDKVNPADYPLFWRNVRENVAQSTNFKKSIEEHFLATECGMISDPWRHAGQLSSPYFEKLFGLFLGKWLLKIVQTSQRWSMRLLDSYWYRTNHSAGNNPNMLSLAFLFEPIPARLEDPSGLVGAEGLPPAAPDEVSQAIDILNKMNGLCDIDLHLHQNKPELEDAIVKSEELLRKAGYNVASYRQWAMNALPIFSDQQLTITN